ncbi:MAG: hypothetical protein K0B81_04320 [Candidatus Cloacimonetes bacterium]|nr:hypothetical protein [Candidatus Cloacimonadota bacterium]
MIHKIPCLLLLLFIVFSVKILSADFSIMEFSNPYKYEWFEEEDRITFRDSLEYRTMILSEYDELKQSTMTNALKTAFLPGWGHFTLRSYTKGQIFLGAQLALLGSSLYYYEKAMIHYRRYEKATQIDEINEHYDNALLPYRQSNLLLGLFIVVWGYTIYDVIVETNQHNWNIWNDLVQQNSNQALIITPTGITLRF